MAVRSLRCWNPRHTREGLPCLKCQSRCAWGLGDRPPEHSDRENTPGNPIGECQTARQALRRCPLARFNATAAYEDCCCTSMPQRHASQATRSTALSTVCAAVVASAARRVVRRMSPSSASAHAVPTTMAGSADRAPAPRRTGCTHKR